MPDEEKVMETIARNLVAARKKREWTQKDLSLRSGVSMRSIQNYENARCMMSVYALYRLSLALGISPLALMGIKNRVRQ